MSTFLDTKENIDVSEKSDEELLTLSIDHPKYFGMIVDRYQSAFLRKARNIVDSPETAQDTVQDTFVKIYKHASQFQVQEGASFKSWAYRILLNQCFTQYRKTEKKRLHTLVLEPEHYESLPDKKDLFENDLFLRDCVQSVLTRMPKSLARILDLYFLKGYSQKEIAQREQLSLAAVRVRVFRAKRTYRKLSEQYCLQ
ncbi:hypothetical protein COB55_03000 [Candidatus Wolfebacteria bacterium]|nr:MAG: hypothetical protein COB55_03000 [Candidatus Wolfebacteria bacterium]